MEAFRLTSPADRRQTLHGTVRVGGAKNSALKLMAASLLASGRTTITNLPDILDVDVRIGAEHVITVPEGTELVVTSPGLRPDHPLLVHAAQSGIPVWGEVELAWRMRPRVGAAPWITVTG